MAKGKQNKGALSDAQERFCQEYVVDLQAQAAAIRAGYAKAGAHVRASRLLRSERIAQRIEELKAERAKRTEITADQVVKRIDEISRADVLEIFDEKNCLRPIKDIPPEIRRCIASIEIEELFDFKDGEKEWIGYTKKIKFWNKPISNDQLMKHTGGYKPVELKGKLTLEQLVAAAGEDGEDKE